MTAFGHFDDAQSAYVITDPTPPRPWINYLGNRRLRAFVSQNAGGLMWHMEPYSRRLTRYHYTAAPGDRPGFYLYVRDRRTGAVWNPHFAPSCTALERFACAHRPGVTAFTATRDGVTVQVTYAIPPADDVLLWDVQVRNDGDAATDLELVSYMEFGLLEFMREAVGWCYLKSHFGLAYDATLNAIRYDYHVFEAPYTPAMLFGCSESPSGWSCSRDAFIGATGSYGQPAALRPGVALGRTDLPGGGQACSVLGVDLRLTPGESRDLGYVFALADTWPEAEARLARYRSAAAIRAGIAAVDAFWAERLTRCQVHSGDAALDRAINTWMPYNSVVALDLARTISTDHMGTDGLRYRDTTQDAMAVTGIDPDFALLRLRQVFATQTAEGGGCFAFYPDDRRPISDAPRRSDNTVWQVYTVHALIAETGDMALLDEPVPYRDGSSGSIDDHIRRGLHYIYARRGPRGLPTLFHADWNDGLALFRDEDAESIMLGMQLVYACRLYRELCDRRGQTADSAWCDAVITALTAILNSDLCWDGRWYRRLLLSNGKTLGSAANAQGQIYLNPQSWAVISGVGDYQGRGALAMDAVAERLDSDCGLQILTPPFTGIPEPTDPPLGSNPGIGENGGIFCHAHAWAVIAESLLGNGERAYRYMRAILPECVSARMGAAHYEREPYVFVSSIVGPGSQRFGQGGISWLTGTANWMQVAGLHYLLGIRPTLDGLTLAPCLPAAITHVQATRHFRGQCYHIDIHHSGGRSLGTLTLQDA